jgi:hypothetical protein|tara:strand:+ start:112 stop:834 length:723 start_codon:yes stop_codon:yes gene_type:complete
MDISSNFKDNLKRTIKQSPVGHKLKELIPLEVREEDKNPWAICTSKLGLVGRKKSSYTEAEEKKFEACVMSVKGETKEETDEATGAGSAGAYVGPLFSPTKKEDMEEATTSSSSGAYVGPLGHAKNKKNWRGAAKPTWPGGKFVEVKKKCRTFPYCNQGDINALKLWENTKIKQAITEVSKKTGKTKKELKKLIKKEIEELIRRGFYKSPITSLVGDYKMDKPIGKIFSMVPKGVSNKYE